MLEVVVVVALVEVLGKVVVTDVGVSRKVVVVGAVVVLVVV